MSIHREEREKHKLKVARLSIFIAMLGIGLAVFVVSDFNSKEKARQDAKERESEERQFEEWKKSGGEYRSAFLSKLSSSKLNFDVPPESYARLAHQMEQRLGQFSKVSWGYGGVNYRLVTFQGLPIFAEVLNQNMEKGAPPGDRITGMTLDSTSVTRDTYWPSGDPPGWERNVSLCGLRIGDVVPPSARLLHKNVFMDKCKGHWKLFLYTEDDTRKILSLAANDDRFSAMPIYPAR